MEDFQTDQNVNGSRTYVLGDVHNNTVEGFWSILKRGVYGVYRVISRKYLQSYVDEYAYRYNHRGDKNMFYSLFKQVAEVKLLRLPLA